MTDCASTCGPLGSNGTIQILAGYEKVYYVNLFYTDTGAPFDLTGATQIVAIHPGAAGTPVEEFLAPPAGPTTTGNTTITSNQITGVASIVGIVPGQVISGTGVPAATTVVSVSGTTVVMSANATASNTGVTLSFSPNNNVVVVGAPGAGLIEVTIPAYDSSLLQPNPNTLQNQDLQISVTNSAGVSGFLIQAVLNIVAPTYGVV